MTGLRDTKKAELRQKLYGAALARFRTDGYDATSVADICKDVGVAKGTFFNHFPSKADILAEWYDRAMKTSEQSARLPADAPVEHILADRALSAVSLTRTEPELWRAKHAHAPSAASIQAREAETDDRFIATAVAILQNARHRGEIDTTVDVHALAEIYLALVTGTIREWLNTGERFVLEDTLISRIRNLIQLARP